MTYAPNTRRFFDADSHIMELPNFLKLYADPEIRDDMPEVSYSASLMTDDEVAEQSNFASRWASPRSCLCERCDCQHP